jgi:hypothetical protein
MITFRRTKPAFTSPTISPSWTFSRSTSSWDSRDTVGFSIVQPTISSLKCISPFFVAHRMTWYDVICMAMYGALCAIYCTYFLGHEQQRALASDWPVSPTFCRELVLFDHVSLKTTLVMIDDLCKLS